MKDGKHYLHDTIPEYLAWHFGIEIDLVRAVIYDENYHLSMEAIAVTLELVGILKVQTGKECGTAYFYLESIFKNKIKEDHDIQELYSPISFSSWEEIPLKNLLFLSDAYFYDLTPQSDDLVYLDKQLGKNGLGKTPKNTFYSDEDRKRYQKRVLELNISHASQRAVINSKLSNELMNDPPPYSDLVNLINDLVETLPGGDFETAFVPYLEIYQHTAIQALKISNLNNATVSTCNLYEINMHLLGLYLWNALSQIGHPLPQPSQDLMNASRHHKIDLRTNQPPYL